MYSSRAGLYVTKCKGEPDSKLMVLAGILDVGQSYLQIGLRSGNKCMMSRLRHEQPNASHDPSGQFPCSILSFHPRLA